MRSPDVVDPVYYLPDYQRLRSVKITTCLATYIFDKCLFYAAFHHTGRSDAVFTVKIAADDRRANIP